MNFAKCLRNGTFWLTKICFYFDMSDLAKNLSVFLTDCGKNNK